MARSIRDIAKQVASPDDLVPFPQVFADQLSELVQGTTPSQNIQHGEFVSASGIVMVLRPADEKH